MTLGNGPNAVVELLKSEWRVSRPGRADVPPIAEDPIRNNRGVVIIENREEEAINHAIHDLIHVYHPQAGPIDVQDRGYKEQNLLETVQIDIDLTDRNDPDNPGIRLAATDRMVGQESEIDSSGFSLGGESGGTLGGESGGTLGTTETLTRKAHPGILGEVKYILELVRRGYRQWDRVDHTVVNLQLQNSNATASYDVGLEKIAENTFEPQSRL